MALDSGMNTVFLWRLKTVTALYCKETSSWDILQLMSLMFDRYFRRGRNSFCKQNCKSSVIFNNIICSS